MEVSIRRRRRSFPHQAGFINPGSVSSLVLLLRHWHIIITVLPALPMQLARARRRPPARNLAIGGLLMSLSYQALPKLHKPTDTVPTRRVKRVPNSSGQKRGDLEIKRLNVPMWFTSFMAVLLKMSAMVSFSTPIQIRCSLSRQ